MCDCAHPLLAVLLSPSLLPLLALLTSGLLWKLQRQRGRAHPAVEHSPGTPLLLPSAQPEGHGRSGPTRWICLQFYTSVFEDCEDDSKAGSSTQLGLRCLWPRASPKQNPDASKSATWDGAAAAGCHSRPGPRVGGRDGGSVGRGQAGAALLTHSTVPKWHRRFDVYLYMSVCTYHMSVFNLWVGACTAPTLSQTQMSSYGRSNGSRESWTEAFCALRCLNRLSWSFLAVLRCPGSSGVHCSAPRHRKGLCQNVSHCVLAAECHCLVLVSLSAGACCLLPRLTRAASSSKLIPSPSPDHWHGGTQPLPGTCCCCGQRVGLIPGMLQDGDSTVPPALDLCLPEVWPSPGPAQWWRSRHMKDPALREQSCGKGNVPSRGHVKL